MSPPFVRPPIEDRSKYEKLIPGAYDVTSNSSDEEENVKTKKKKKICIPEKLHSVYKSVELPLKNLRCERAKNEDKKKKTSDNRNDSVDVDSDDSIGSASDLKADEDRTEIPVKEDAISESIRTCGSSAYHAECESMATREEEYFKKPPKLHQNKKINNEPTQNEDIRFVGHRYGEKPLLMDDELDSDCESKYQRWKETADNNSKSNKWFTLTSGVEDSKDVFALAPFEKQRLKTKSIKIKNGDSQHSLHVDKVSEISQSFTTDSFAHFASYNESEDSKVGDTSSSMISLNPFLITDIANVQNMSTPEPVNSDMHPFTRINNETTFQASFSDQEFSCDFSKPKNVSILSENKYYSGEIRLERQADHGLPDLFAQNVLPDFTKENSSEDRFEKNQKIKKDKKRDKYQLIDDLSSEKSEVFSAKPVKVSRNTHSYKKVNIKAKKSSLKLKVDGGFSNMSFEDFPVDERNVIESSIMPYEVLRSPQQEEKKFGSKRIGNPFS